ncbi:MAG: HEAT repeat domain-containing protein [Planctomycetota bacterium]|nr:HEAT repeat domain-containing protein [Planctomycetota bacterium]
MRRRTASSRLLAVVFLLGLVAVASAADPAEDARIREAKTLIERLGTLAKAADKPGVERALPRLVKLHNELKSGSTRAKLQKAAGALLGEESLGGTRLAVADAFGRLNDPKGAWKVLKGYLPATKLTAVGPLPLRVIQAVGALAPDAAIPTLQQLMHKSKDANVSRYAIQALGRYGWSKRRVAVLDELLGFLKRLRPGNVAYKKGQAGGDAARRRYAFLRETLVAALDTLTGRKLGDPDKWLEAYKENKKQLGRLFTFER